MSRSYRKPYCAITGHGSAHDDKKHAARGVRHAQNQSLHAFNGADWDEFIIPVREECSWNNTYSWGRDGRQTLQYPPSMQDWWMFRDWEGLLSQEEIEINFAKAQEKYDKLKRK